VRTTLALRHDAAVLRRAATALAARARAERAGELTLTEVAVLGRLATHGPITPGEVAQQLRMLPQSLTRTLASLQQRGALHRTTDPTDRRASLLEVTDAGLAALRAEMAPRDAWTARAIAAVCTTDERATLRQAADIMQRLVEFGGGVAPVEP
jgi:DNA-binding MarR family transcriptional regulator